MDDILQRRPATLAGAQRGTAETHSAFGSKAPPTWGQDLCPRWAGAGNRPWFCRCWYLAVMHGLRAAMPRAGTLVQLQMVQAAQRGPGLAEQRSRLPRVG